MPTSLKVKTLTRYPGTGAPWASTPVPRETGDFYISPTGSDSNDGLTTSTPWAITALMTKRATYAGSKVVLMNGTYNVHAYQNANDTAYSPTFNVAGGSVGDPTIIIAETPRGAHIVAKSGSTYGGSLASVEHPGILGHTPIGRTANLGAGSTFYAGNAVTGYVTFDGLKVSGAIGQLLRFGLLDTDTGSSLYGPYPGIVVQNCELYDTNAVGATAGGNLSGISLNNCDAAQIVNNYIHDLTGYGGSAYNDGVLQWNSRNSLYEYNTIVNAGGFHDKRGATYLNAYGGTLRYNYVDTSVASDATAILDFTGNYTSVQAGSTLSIYGNVLISALGILLDRGDFGGAISTTENVIVYNNTLILPTTGTSTERGFFSTVAATPGASFYNNVCWFESGSPSFQSDGAALLIPTTTPGTIDYNVYHQGINKWSRFDIANGAYPDTSYTTIADWRTATGQEAGSSVSLSSSPFVGTGSRALAYQLTGATLPVGFGRVGGVSGGGAVDAGAWGLSPSRIGCDF